MNKFSLLYVLPFLFFSIQSNAAGSNSFGEAFLRGVQASNNSRQRANQNDNSAFSEMATWTGEQKNVQTVTGQERLKCRYYYNGRYFSKLFRGFSCPSSIQVQ